MNTKKLTIEQLRRLKDLVDNELERQDLIQDKEYIDELEALLLDLSLVETEII